MSSNSGIKKLKCTGCGQFFPSRNALTKHIKFSTGKCTQASTVFNCPHCDREFSNQKGLDHHIRLNQYCSVLADPQKMSLIPFPSSGKTKNNSSSAENISDFNMDIDEYSSQWTKKRRQIEHNIESTSISEYITADKSNMLVQRGIDATNSMNFTHKYSVQEISSLFLSRRYKSSCSDACSPVLERFSLHPELKVSFNVKFIQSDPCLQLAQNDLFLLGILSSRTKFSSPTVCSNINILTTDLMNNFALSLMDNSCNTIPGFGPWTKDISRSDVTDFILKYAIFWVPPSINLLSDNATPDSALVQQQNHQQELITIEDYVDLHAIQDSDSESNLEVVDITNMDDTQNVGNAILITDSTEEPEEQVDDVVDTVMTSFQESIAQTRIHSMYNDNDIANLELYNILKASGAPSYLFDEIQSWSYKHSSKLFFGNSAMLQRRDKFVRNMATKVYGDSFSSQMKPSVKVLRLPSGNTVEVVVCSFKAQLVSLLTDQNLMRTENLLLDSRNPFGEVPDGILSELNTGWWHKETRLEICTDLNRHILLPIVVFLDASNVDKNGRLQVNPMTFTLGIFKRSVRNQAAAWRTMGYVDDQLHYLDPDVRKSMDKSSKAQDVHAIISLILEEFKEIQGPDGGFAWSLELDSRKFDVVFKVAVQVIIGDCKGNDLLCGRFGSHSLNVKRLCRDCDVLTLSGDDCNHLCTYITRDHTENQSKDEMRDLSFHWIKNAFTDVYFGARNLGVTQVTPPEPLHGFRLGICKYLFEGFQNQCPKETMTLINYTAMRLSKYSCRSSVRNLPDLQSFRRKGVSKCNTLSGDEQYARVFCIYLTLLVPEVLESLSTANRFESRTFTNDDGSEYKRNVNIGPMGFVKAKNWLKLLSLTVCLNSWIMSPEHPRHDLELRTFRRNNNRSLEREGKAQQVIRSYMSLYKVVVDRTNGNGLKIPKFHQLLHYVDQILKDGSLLNIDGGRCESIATTNYTNPGRRTQMRQDSFMKQLAYCHYSDVAVNAASFNSTIPYMKLTQDNKELHNNDDITNALCGTRFLLLFKEDSVERNGPSLELVWQGKKPRQGFSHTLCSAVARRLWMHSGQMNAICQNSKVMGYTDYKSGDTIFRAHPSYRDDGCWFDWAFIEWEDGENPVPAKILMFLDLEGCTFSDEEESNNDNPNVTAQQQLLRTHPDIRYLKKERYVVIQTALESFEDRECNARYRVDNPLCERLRLEQSWRIVPLDSIVAPAFVVPECTDQTTQSTIEHVLIKDKLEWSEIFLSNH